MSLSCCSQLAAIQGLTLAYPSSTSYATTEKSYFSLQEGSVAPACIAKPTTSEYVAAIVSALVPQDCHFAIKSHGHAPAAGFANVENGVTVDLTALNSVSVNGDHSVTSVGAGASWLDVYSFLEPLNKTAAGGRNGGVGVGGLTLGGGISYFSPQVGFTCDTVQNYEVVLASGQLVNANASSHPDLFRALKGGGNNFGVVTRFDLQTVSLPGGQMLGGSIANDMSYREEVFDAFVKIANASSYDVHASIVLEFIFNTSSKAWSLASTPIYTEPVLDPPVYQELFAIPNITSSVELRNLSTFANESALPQSNTLFYTGTYAASFELMDAIFEIANTSLYPVSDSILWIFALEPLPTNIVTPGAGKNVLGTSPADGTGMILLVTAIWEDTTLNSQVHIIAEDLMSNIADAAKKMNALHRFVYANYADATQNPFASYGRCSEEFLRITAARYDPTNVFRRLVTGGFKIVDW